MRDSSVAASQSYSRVDFDKTESLASRVSDDEELELGPAEVSVSRGENGALSIFRHGMFDGLGGVEMVRLDPVTRILHIYPRPGADVAPSSTAADARPREIRIDTTVWPWPGSKPIGETERGEYRLEGIPEGLGVMFTYGLSLPKPYRGLARAMESQAGCSVLQLGAAQSAGVDGDVLHVSLEAFERFVQAVDRQQRRSATVVTRLKEAEAHNLVAEAIGARTVTPSPGRAPIIRAITQVVSGATQFDVAGRDELLRLAASESATAARENAETLGRLRHDLEIVTLDELIKGYRAALDGPQAADEKRWQEFLEVNDFALQQLFAAPVVFAGREILVNLPDVHGAAYKTVDFLLWNPVAMTVHLIEIKTPKTPLMAANPYRGRGAAEVYPPHAKLTGAVAQLQSQIEGARGGDLKILLAASSDMPNIDTRIVRGAVVAGRLDALTETQRISFLRYRDGLAGVDLVTYDEILTRLEGLQGLLATAASHQGPRTRPQS